MRVIKEHVLSNARRYFIALSLLNLFALEVRGSAYNPVEHAWKGTRDLSEPSSLGILFLGTAATLGALAWIDTPVHRYFANQNRLGKSARFGNSVWGTGAPEVAIAGTTLA